MFLVTSTVVKAHSTLLTQLRLVMCSYNSFYLDSVNSKKGGKKGQINIIFQFSEGSFVPRRGGRQRKSRGRQLKKKSLKLVSKQQLGQSQKELHNVLLMRCVFTLIWAMLFYEGMRYKNVRVYLSMIYIS